MNTIHLNKSSTKIICKIKFTLTYNIYYNAPIYLVDFTFNNFSLLLNTPFSPYNLLLLTKHETVKSIIN